MKRFKVILKKAFKFFANPHLLLCFGLAWIITNGWCYLLLGVGMLFDISWMQAVAGGYLAFLWLPITPEKIVTTIIAMFFLRVFFPRDENTLGVLKDMLEKAKAKLRQKKEKRKQKRS